MFYLFLGFLKVGSLRRMGGGGGGGGGGIFLKKEGKSEGDGLKWEGLLPTFVWKWFLTLATEP